MTEQRCKTCDSKLVVKENMFFYRGRFFTGLVCEPCNALYDNPEDSFWEYVKAYHQENVGEESRPGGLNG